MNAKWRNPTDTEIKNEWDWEYVRHIQGKNPMWDLWPDFDTFKSAVKRARKVEVSPSIDNRIEYRSKERSIEGLKDLVSGYQYPRDVDRIIKGYKKGEPVPYPMVLKKGNYMRVLGGNTRMDVAFILHINPVVLMIEPLKVRESMKLMSIMKESGWSDIFKPANVVAHWAPKRGQYVCDLCGKELGKGGQDRTIVHKHLEEKHKLHPSVTHPAGDSIYKEPDAKVVKEDEVGSVWNADDDTQTWNKRFASKHGPGIQIEADDKTLGVVPVFQAGSDFGTVPSATATAKFLQEKIEAPVVSVQVSTLGGAKNVSILLMVSLDEKKDWHNGILENSRYTRFHFYNNGKLEQFSGGHGWAKKFRKVQVKSAAEAVAKINQYIKTATPIKEVSNTVKKKCQYCGQMRSEWLIKSHEKSCPKNPHAVKQYGNISPHDLLHPVKEGSEWEQDDKGEPCYNCGGEGYVQAGHVCPDCRGTGRKDLYENMDDRAAAPFQEADENVDCPACQGTGETGHEDCQRCGGTGKLTRMAWERLYGNRKTMKVSESSLKPTWVSRHFPRGTTVRIKKDNKEGTVCGYFLALGDKGQLQVDVQGEKFARQVRPEDVVILHKGGTPYVVGSTKLTELLPKGIKKGE